MYFKMDNFVNPVLDSNPADEWFEMPEDVQVNLMYLWNLLEVLHKHIQKPIQLNSTWRPEGRNTSAHFFGKAVDIQFSDPKIPDEAYIEIMEFLKTTDKVNNFRAILEWKEKRPWIHIDRNYRKVSHRLTKRALLVGYPRPNGMFFDLYTGRLPQSYITT